MKSNLIIAVNKIDTIGESINPNDSDLRWNIVDNVPSPKLKKAIKQKLSDIVDKLIDEQLIDDINGLQQHQLVFYSAVFNYNLRDFVLAITKAGKRGWIWPATVGLEVVGKWSDAKLNL